MSRFGNLEFGDELDGRPDFEPELKDEGYYFREAWRGFEQGQFEHALRAFAKVLEYNPANTGAWSGQVRMLIELGEFREAKVWADKALERFPADPELLAAKAVALARLGDLHAALAFSDASVEERGDSPYTWLARGDVLMARREKRADYCFEKAALLAPQSWFVQWLTSRIHFFYEKFALALKAAQQALAFDSAQVAVWLQLGCCQEALGLARAAQTSYEQAAQLNPACRQAEQALRGLKPPGLLASLRSRWRQMFSQ